MVCTLFSLNQHTSMLAAGIRLLAYKHRVYGVYGRSVGNSTERPGALITSINRTQSTMVMSPDVYDYYDVRKWGNRLTLGLNAAENTDHMKNNLK